MNLESGKTLQCYWIVIKYILIQPAWSTAYNSVMLMDITLILKYGVKLCCLWSSGQSSWPQIQRSGFESQRYQIFWVVGLERGPLSLMSTTEEILGRKSSGFGLESREYGCRDPSRWQRGTLFLYLQTLALTSPTCGCRLVGIFRSRTQATEFLWYKTCGRNISGTRKTVTVLNMDYVSFLFNGE
jgi:hypothetical protein